ncbi:MAG: FtsW/RodA/SpoVE family cell cycle protein [Rikenellaceae bacterium]
MARKYSVRTLRHIAATRQTIKNITPTQSWFRGDRVLWIIIAVLSIVSVLVVYSSTAKMAYDDAAIKSTSQFLQQQIGSLIFGAIALFASAYLFSSRFYRGFAPWAYGASMILTVAAYIFGNVTNGAARWLPLMGFQFQPSEALKVATIMLLARQLAARQDKIEKLQIIPTWNIFNWGLPEQKKIINEGFKPILLPMLMACVVILPAHTSSAVLLFGASMVVLMIGRVRVSELRKILLLMALLGGVYFLVGAGRSDTAEGRLSTWIELWRTDRSEVATEDLADTERSMIAMYNGGLIGVGPGKSVMRVEMIHPESDYAFAFFVEEYGSLFAIALLLLYIWIFFRAITIVERCGTIFPALLVLGLAVMITTQALLHIAVTINLIPETGQTLPLISRGGSSLLFNSIALGMILSVSRQNEEHSHDMPKSQSIYEE